MTFDFRSVTKSFMYIREKKALKSLLPKEFKYGPFSYIIFPQARHYCLESASIVFLENL